MMLTKDEQDAIVRTRLPLMLYVSRRLERHPGLSTAQELPGLPIKDLFALSVTTCSRKDLIDDYVRENPDRLTAGDLAIVEGFKHAIYGKFVMMRHLKDHTILLGHKKVPIAYGIVGLVDELPNHLTDLPVVVDSVLLPFRGRITHDVAFLVCPDMFGPGARKGLAEAYREAESRYGVVTSLPFSGKERPDADEARLRSLLASRKSREANIDEVRALMSKTHELRLVYHEGIGALASRDHRRGLKDVGVEGGWYATIEGVLIAGGTTREDVERTVAALVPEDRRELVQIYRAKRK